MMEANRRHALMQEKAPILYRNAISFSQAQSSTAIYNGCGYKNNTYQSSNDSGQVVEASISGYFTTGYIPYQAPAKGVPPTIEIIGAEFSDNACRLYFYANDKTVIYAPWITGTSTGDAALTFSYTKVILGDKHFKLVPAVASDGDWAPGGGAGQGTTTFIRFTLKGQGENATIRIGLKGDVNGDGIINNADRTALTNYINGSGSVNLYNADVNGDGIINARDSQALYELINSMNTESMIVCRNEIPFSQDTNGSIYNGTGYIANKYLASNGTLADFWSTCYTTGFIPCKPGDIVRLKNVTMQNGHTNAGYHRLCFFNSSKAIVGSAFQMQNSSLPAQGWVTLDSNKMLKQFTVPSNTTYSSVAYVRLTADYIGSDSLVTVNTEIK